MTYKIPISGGPHSGKTTLIERLRCELPNAYFVPEPAERVISRELGKKALDQAYQPILPTESYPEFLPLVIKESLELEAEIPSNAQFAILDRSLIDNLAYMQLNNYFEGNIELLSHIKTACYIAGILLDLVGSYQQTAVRREDCTIATKLSTILKQTYGQFMPVVDLQDIGLERRTSFVVGLVKGIELSCRTRGQSIGS